MGLFFKKVEKILCGIEGALVVALVGVLVVLSLAQIVSRNFFSHTVLWIDPLLRHAVLWVAFLSAGVATKRHHHIKIDLLPRLLPKKAGRVNDVLAGAISAVVCFVLGYYSSLFVLDEKLYGGNLFGRFPVWFFEVIIPAGFFLIGIHFVFAVFFPAEKPEQAL